MKPSKAVNNTIWVEEEDIPAEQDFDIYSEFDEEEALDRGMKANEVAFLKGFRKSG